nr:hypothetical protein [uncultured Blautia sp.]
MKVWIYGKEYKVNNNIAASAKKTVLQILEKVRTETDVRGFNEYYVGFVVMMYIVSSTILNQFSTENIKKILDEIDKDELEK